jgi:hypothetical protein
MQKLPFDELHSALALGVSNQRIDQGEAVPAFLTKKAIEKAESLAKSGFDLD